MLILQGKKIAIPRTGSLLFDLPEIKKGDPKFKRLDNYHTWIIMPLLGIFIPTFTGLLEPAMFTPAGLLLQYLVFICIALVIYKGNLFFSQFFRIRYQGVVPYKKLVLIYSLVNMAYTGIISLASLSTWNSFVASSAPFAQPVIVTTLVILAAALFINNLYEIFYLKTANTESETKLQLLENARLEAEMQALNSQIDPHFMYNALTSLSYLLQQNPSEADNYNAMLAAQYRYVLTNKCRNLVPLEEELEFCRQYFAIQQLRFGNTVQLQVLGGGRDMKPLQVPPLSLQTLVENALKHNRFSEQEPLVVQIHVTQGHVRVMNKIQPLAYPAPGTGTGLANLERRVRMLSNKTLVVERLNERFSVRLPTTEV